MALRRVLIANRSEIALRVVRACRELELESVAVYSTADESALHVREADHAVCIGKPAARQSYLSIEALLEAARSAEADAVHPGYGFLAENAAFARACADAGLVWVGPSAEAIERMGDKAAARELARAAGVPVVPGTPGTVDAGEAAAVAEELGYPVMVKAAGGGGGRGIRVVREASEVSDAVDGAAREADAAFGNPALYVEKVIERARHVEVQVIADTHGSAVHLFERDCSIQRRRQKLLEESPSPGLDSGVRSEMAAAAVRLAEHAG